MDLDRASTYALHRLGDELPPELTYHNLAHTQDEVVPAAKRFAKMMGVGKTDGNALVILLTAAYFHDLGMVISPAEHEAQSAQIIRAVLPDFGYSTEQIAQISAVIMATKLPQTPTNLLGQILADADLDVLGRGDFLDRNRALRREMAALGNVMSDAAWYRGQLKFMENHRYFTRAAREIRGEGKSRNIQHIRHLFEASRNT